MQLDPKNDFNEFYASIVELVTSRSQWSNGNCIHWWYICKSL
uniref:Uncharacterized protein n=1 Tax=Rhizophora mucronata TaxID=61149 RepID=A0A2P2QBQ4_RHIMU